ncbi:MAG: YitT family protein [Erysipelotrichaceae bacterium]|nr:YitT family protein [Erysipelotrichaceae bacterium]
MKKITKKDIQTFFFIVLSATLYSLNMKTFVNAGNLYPGGFTGISLLITRCLSAFGGIEIPFGILYTVLHIYPTILVYKYVGHRFTIFSVMQYLLVSLLTSFLPAFPVTEDILLIAVFGGMINGLSISIALRHGASSGGTDFIAIYFANKFNIPTWNYVMAFNAMILCIAGYLFGWETALYSIIFQYCSTQVVNLRHDRYKLVTLMVVSEKRQEVSDAVFKTCRHGITIMDGEGAYSHSMKNVMMMTINSYQVQEVVQAVKKADPKVFINIFKTERIVGNYYQKPLD